MTACRRSALEKELQEEGLPESAKQQILMNLAKSESDYTRLQRQRMTADDFESLRIIGRGAFGEVRYTGTQLVRFVVKGST